MVALIRDDLFYFNENSAILKRLMHFPPQENVFNLICFTDKQINKLVTKPTATAKEVKNYLDKAKEDDNEMNFFGSKSSKDKDKSKRRLSGKVIKNEENDFFDSGTKTKSTTLVKTVLEDANDFLVGNNSEIKIDFTQDLNPTVPVKKTSKELKNKISSLIK